MDGFGRPLVDSLSLESAWAPIVQSIPSILAPHRFHWEERTEGMVMVPLKRLRTLLSIPLGLRQLGSTHLNRSLW